MGWLDLHMHSNYSNDGEYSPKELMSLCNSNGVRVAAIADHNTVKGIKEAQYWAERQGVILIPAIELDCTFKGVNLHVLGYWIDSENESFLKNEKMILEQEQKASIKLIELVKEIGIDFNEVDVLKIAKDGVVTGEMIAEVVLQTDGNEKNPILKSYHEGGNRSDNPYVNFYWDFCSQGKPAYVPISYIGLNEAVNMIHQSGGIAVLAHPGNNVKENKKLLSEIASQGICGLEVYSSYHKPEQTAYYKEQSQLLGLAMSCGSDFHGKTKPSIVIGSIECESLESERMNELLEKRKQA